VASVWIKTRRTKGGSTRRRVEFRLGGRDSRVQYGGSFKTLREATARRNYIAGELAAKRVPDLTHVESEAPKLPMFPGAFRRLAREPRRRRRADAQHAPVVGRPHLQGRAPSARPPRR
jgi:hypothetical protein